nr:MFS transporter [Candidatus Njordarchaeota archaeon]
MQRHATTRLAPTPLVITLLSSFATSCAAIFVPILAEQLGADDTLIGIIGAVYALALFASSYIFGRESDVHGRILYIKIGLGTSVIAFLIQVLSDPTFFAPILANPLLLALSRFLAGFTAGISPAALAAYVYDVKGSLGKFSAYGSLGSGLGNLVAGLTALTGTIVAGLISLYSGVFIISSLCFLIAFLISLPMSSKNNRHLKVPFFPTTLMKKNWYVYSAFFFRHFGANAIWVIYPLFIVSVGGNQFWIGVIYFLNAFTQFFIMQLLGRFTDRRLLGTGLLLSTATFVAISLSQSFYWLLPTQLLLASAWSCLYVGSIVFLMEHNIEKATSTGILNSVANLATVLGSLLGGVVSQFFGYLATMYVAALLTLFGYALFKIGVRKAFKARTRNKMPP